jgi:hypothetical protein
VRCGGTVRGCGALHSGVGLALGRLAHAARLLLLRRASQSTPPARRARLPLCVPLRASPWLSYVMKKPEYAPPKAPQQAGPDPLQLLDYRCHAPGGSIGTRFPRPVRGGTSVCVR